MLLTHKRKTKLSFALGSTNPIKLEMRLRLLDCVSAGLCEIIVVSFRISVCLEDSLHDDRIVAISGNRRIFIT